MSVLVKATVCGALLFSFGIDFCESVSASSLNTQINGYKYEISPQNVTKVRAKPLYNNGIPVVEAELWIGTVESETFSYPELDSFTGNAHGHSLAYLRNLNLTVRGKKITIPHSAIAGLFYPTSIGLKGSDTKFSVSIIGSSGAGTWVCHLVFKDGLIRKRTLIDGEFKSELSEETIYEFPNN